MFNYQNQTMQALEIWWALPLQSEESGYHCPQPQVGHYLSLFSFCLNNLSLYKLSPGSTCRKTIVLSIKRLCQTLFSSQYINDFLFYCHENFMKQEQLLLPLQKLGESLNNLEVRELVSGEVRIQTQVLYSRKCALTSCHM